jgi:ankyrin repeat protein
MSAEGKATIPHPAVTICNTLWGSALTFSPFSVAAGATGDAPKPVSFDRLFPEEQSLVETCREAGLEREPLQLCSLLLGSSSYRALALLLKNGVLSVSQPLSSEQATLPHLACALGLPPAINAIRDTLNGSTNSSFVWSIKDGEGRIPEEVCFNSELVKKLPHRPLFGRKKNNSSLPRPPNDSHRRATFQLAKEPENFYSLIVALRSSQFNVDSERDENGDLLIHTAVHGGIPSLPLLLSLLNHFKADVNARDGSGATPLALACRLGHSRVAEVLVCVGGADMGSRESDRGTTALHSAALGGHPDVVRMLLRRGADAAAEDEQGCDAGFLAKRAGHHECRQIIVQHSRGRFTSLAAQTITGSLDIAMVRRADVCQVTEDGSTLLNLAAKHGHAHLLSQLVKFETCPLDYRQMKIPDLLDTSMELSASLRDLPESGEHPFKSALHFAAQGGYLQCVQILLDAHTHPSLPDCDGWLPLHHACDSEHVDIVRLLLKYPSTLVLSGLHPAMNLAKGRCNNDIITLLEEAMLRWVVGPDPKELGARWFH